MITIYHESPCRIEISQQRDQNFYQGQDWPTRRLSFSILHGQTHDGLFFSHFSNVFLSEHKKSKKREKINILLVRFTLFLRSRVFLLGI